jgi:DNA-directed RNA polymerase subunit RPC12/RpoP
MIKLEVSMAVALYLFFSVVIVLVLWMFSGYRGRQRKFSSEDRYIWHCSICDHTYVDSIHEGLSQCPQCGSYVEKAEAVKEVS